MAKITTDDIWYKSIADAIRSKKPDAGQMMPRQMADHILTLFLKEMPPLTKPAYQNQIQRGYQAYDQNGNLLTGTAASYADGYRDGYAAAKRGQ